MTKEKKIITAMTIILILLIAIFSYFLINKNAIIKKQAEKIELQAMETNGSNSYITIEDHLKECITTVKEVGSWDISQSNITITITDENKSNYTVDNFFPVITGTKMQTTNGYETYGSSKSSTVTKTYNPETGELYIKGLLSTVSNIGYARTKGIVYLVY